MTCREVATERVCLTLEDGSKVAAVAHYAYADNGTGELIKESTRYTDASGDTVYPSTDISSTVAGDCKTGKCGDGCAFDITKVDRSNATKLWHGDVEQTVEAYTSVAAGWSCADLIKALNTEQNNPNPGITWSCDGEHSVKATGGCPAFLNFSSLRIGVPASGGGEPIDKCEVCGNVNATILEKPTSLMLEQGAGAGVIPAGLKSVTIYNFDATPTTINGGPFEIGPDSVGSISFGTDRGNSVNELLPEYTLAGGDPYWIGHR